MNCKTKWNGLATAVLLSATALPNVSQAYDAINPWRTCSRQRIARSSDDIFWRLVCRLRRDQLMSPKEVFLLDITETWEEAKIAFPAQGRQHYILFPKV
jgi:hypothetical protein